MESWSVDQVCNWLRQRNLGELVPKFREEEVSGAALLALNDRMVQQLVKKIGHQAVLMDLINKYHQQNSGLQSLTCYCGAASPKFTEAISGITDKQLFSSFGPVEQKRYLSPSDNEEGLIDRRVLKQKKNMKSFLARYKTLQWTSSYALPDFPYDVKCILAEKKCPDHSMRIRIIEFLQADMTKYLKGSLYPNSQQYNIVVNALLQAYPFLNEGGNGFLLWKRALKDRFKYVRRPIEDDEQVLRNKCKFGHRRGQSRKPVSAENKPLDIKLRIEAITKPRLLVEEAEKGSPKHFLLAQMMKMNELSWKKEEPACVDSRVMDAHIDWLQREYLKAQRDWEQVDSRMRVTIGVRRKMIRDKAPLKEVLRLFPFLRCPYQLFREFQLLTHMDIYKKTVEILETYSENILSLHVVRNNRIHIMLQENLKLHAEEDVLKGAGAFSNRGGRSSCWPVPLPLSGGAPDRKRPWNPSEAAGCSWEQALPAGMKMTAACLLLPEVFGEDAALFAAVNEEVTVATPVLTVRNPFSVTACAFAVCVGREELARLDACAPALAVLVAAFHVFDIPWPQGLRSTLAFLAPWRAA